MRDAARRVLERADELAGFTEERGRITRPLASPVQRILVKRQISCGDLRVVARVKPDSNGRFSVTLTGPRPDRVYVFRFRTRVRYDAGDPRLMRTYTLPRYVLGT